MPHPLEYQSPRADAPDPIRPGRLTWALSIATTAVWLASMLTFAVGDFKSTHPSAMKIPGFVVACVMLPWWPVNAAMGLMPLIVWDTARRGVEAADSLLRAAVLSLGATIAVLLLCVALSWPAGLDGYAVGVPLWFIAYGLGTIACWRLARHDPWPT